MRSFKHVVPAIIAMALPAHAYVLNLNDAFVPRHWELLAPANYVHTNVVNRNTHAIRYYLASDGYSTTNTTAELNAVRAAIGQWLAVTNTHFKFEEAGLMDPPVEVNVDDNTNIIYWAKTSVNGHVYVNGDNDEVTGALGVTFSTWDDTDNVLVGADIAFNGVEKKWFTDFSDTASTNVFVEGVALHELGHFLGLCHSPVGGATMLFRGASGLNAQSGLSSDDIAGGRMLYPVTRTNFGAIKGTVNKNGSPTHGAQVFVETAGSNVVAGTVTLPNGTYEVNMLPPGSYKVRVTPLDVQGSLRLCAGFDIARSLNYANNNFTSADIAFQPTTNVPVTISAHTTNTMNFDVTDGAPAFRIAYIRKPTTTSGFYSINFMPVGLTVGQSNYFVSVFSPNLPTNGATFTITGDGLTLGSPTYQPAGSLYVGLNGISMSISVASNATPGLRSFIVTQGTNVAYANGFLEILPAVYDYNFDGLDDTFQRQYFPLFTSAQAAPSADPDGDGANNSAECVAGTVPTNAASVLKMQDVARTNTAATVRWASVSGKKYQVSVCTNAASSFWSNLGVITATGATSLYNDPAATDAFRAYRVQALP